MPIKACGRAVCHRLPRRPGWIKRKAALLASHLKDCLPVRNVNARRALIGGRKQWHTGLRLGHRLALRELSAAAGAMKTRLLALFHSGIAGQEVLLAKLLGEVAVVS